MNSSIGSIVLRFAAMAVLLAQAAAAQAQSVCPYVWDPVLFKRSRVCNEVYNPSPPQPPQPVPVAEPPVRRTTGGRIENQPAAVNPDALDEQPPLLTNVKVQAASAKHASFSPSIPVWPVCGLTGKLAREKRGCHAVSSGDRVSAA